LFPKHLNSSKKRESDIQQLFKERTLHMKWWELAIMQQGRVEYFLLLFKTPSNYRKLVYNKNKNVPKSHAMHTLSIENGMNGA